jgi:hypothetical protein
MARDALTRAALSVLALAVAGCGTMSGPSASGNDALSISTRAVTIATNGQIDLRALLPSGEAVPVRWSIASGTNAPSLGEGEVDPTGVYTAPGSLSADEVSVRVEATLATNPTSTAFATLLVRPGFVQPLLPQNLALTPGATAEVTAQIAEVDAGQVRWSLESSPAGGAAGAGVLGTLSASDCQRNAEQYTTCTVTYTAPGTVPLHDVYVVASVNGSRVTSPLRVLVNNRGIVSDPVANQSIQTGMASLGTSGGNDGDFDTYEDKDGNSFVADCCGGTLGALVEDDQKNQYILSNNHVLAESDQGHAGDTIDQPGLMDGACTPLTRPGSTLHPMATLKYFVPLQSSQTNVDAALAAAAPGAVDPTGSILQLGASGSSQALGAAPPMAGRGETLTAANLGMDVAKSGRTTGLTCSSIDAVALTVRVDYYRDCAETQPYTTKTYVNQIGIGGSHFTDSGDSGALVLDASNAEAIGLYFAGGTDGDGHGLSVVNPIGDVLNELGTQAGTHMSLVGTSTPHAIACLRYDPAVPLDPPHLAPAARQQAQAAAEGPGAALHGAGILAAAPGSSLDSQGDPAVIVYVDQAAATVPQTIDGLRTEVIVTDAASVARGMAPTMPSLEPGVHLGASALAGATAVEQSVAPHLMSDPAIFGVGVTQSLDNPAEAALLVLVDIGRNPLTMPATIGGLRVRYLRLHRFHTTRARDFDGNPATACSLKGLQPVQR